MKHIQKMLMILCVLALVFLSLLTFAFAEETAASPTDLDPAVTEPDEKRPEKTEAGTEETTAPEELNPAVTEHDEERQEGTETGAEETAASEEPDEEGREETEAGSEETEASEELKEEAGDSIEIIITKSLEAGQSWAGTVKRKSQSILKLDFNYDRKVHILIEGHDVLATVQKADRYNEDFPEQLTNPETDMLIIDLDAEAGSYLLTLRAGENSLLAKVSVSIMTQDEYEAWIAENQIEKTEEEPEETAEDKTEEKAEEITEGETKETEPAEQAEGETEKSEEPEGEPEEVQAPDEIEATEETVTEDEDEHEQILASERSINVSLSWDVPDPMIGDTAHFKAILNGYEGLEYSMQWQYSMNKNDWIDLTGETSDTLDIVATEENNFYYWRIIVYLEQDEEI